MLSSPKFEVLSEIGHGGMGYVYRARHVTLDTVMAVKVLNPAFASNAELTVRFEREARVMARLTHDNIVRVFDIDSHEGVRFIVMECIEGTNLGDLIKSRHTFEVGEALSIAAQVASALAYAHGRGGGVIHRDIKPANIILETDTGRAVVTDFGIAKLMDATELTQAAGFMGTLRYSAPEQIRGDEIDGRVDVHGLGLVIYEMLVGRSPHANLTATQMVARLLAPEEAPLEFPANVPPEAQSLIRKATARDREQRFPTASAMLTEIRNLQQLHPAPAPVRPPATAGEVEAGWTLGAVAAAPSPDSESVAEVTEATRLSRAPSRPSAARSWAFVGAAGLVAAIAAFLLVRGQIGSRQLMPVEREREVAKEAATPAAVAAAVPEPLASTPPASLAAATPGAQAVATPPAVAAVIPPAEQSAAAPSAVPEAPLRILATLPESRKLEAKPGDAVEFSAQILDGEGRALPLDWSIDGRAAGSKPILRFEVPAEKRGTSHTIAAQAVGGSGQRERVIWRVAVAASGGPRLVSVNPTSPDVALEAGKAQLFAVDAELPGVPDKLAGLSYEWKLDDALQKGGGRRFELRLDKPGQRTLMAIVHAPDGTTAAHEWRVAVAQPAALARGGAAPGAQPSKAQPPADKDTLEVTPLDEEGSQERAPREQAAVDEPQLAVDKPQLAVEKPAVEKPQLAVDQPQPAEKAPSGKQATEHASLEEQALDEPPAVTSKLIPDIEILDLSDSLSKNKRTLTVEGKVQNRGSGEVQRLVVLVQALDDSGEVVNEGDGVPQPLPLPPGSSASFRISMGNNSKIRSFRVVALPR